MTDRIIEIADCGAYLSLDNGRLKIKFTDHREVTVPVGEIGALILSHPAITVTGALLAALAECGALVVVAGKNHLPVAMQHPLNGNYIQNERFRAQLTAAEPLKKRLWQKIIQAKIFNQSQVLMKFCGQDCGLAGLARQVRSGDPDNIEGRAAVTYWKNLFAQPFLRDREAPDNNVLLNYGYAVLRALTARYCCAAGLHPTLGVHHHNRYDPYCLADDLMEPFRPLIDCQVRELNPHNMPIEEISREQRHKLLQVLIAPVTTGHGHWQLGDLLQQAADQVAQSLTTRELVLEFELKIM